MTQHRDRFNSHNGADDRIPDPLPPAHGTRLIACPNCKQTFEPPPNLQMVQCPSCHRAVQLSTPTFTRSG